MKALLGCAFISLVLDECFSSQAFWPHIPLELHRVQCYLLHGVWGTFQLRRQGVPAPPPHYIWGFKVQQRLLGSGKRRWEPKNQTDPFLNLFSRCRYLQDIATDEISCWQLHISLHFPSLPQMYNIFPWIVERLPGPQHTVFSHIKELRQFIEKKIEEHKKTLDPSSPRDYIDCFLIRMDQVQNLTNIPPVFRNLT